MGPAPMRNDSRTTSTSDDGFRRLELITGVGRRRRWTEEEKAWIVAESLDPATTISAVARRYGLHRERFAAYPRRVRGVADGESLPDPVVHDSPLPARASAGGTSSSTPPSR